MRSTWSLFTKYRSASFWQDERFTAILFCKKMSTLQFTIPPSVNDGMIGLYWKYTFMTIIKYRHDFRVWKLRVAEKKGFFYISVPSVSLHGSAVIHLFLISPLRLSQTRNKPISYWSILFLFINIGFHQVIFI